jgi:hypothetical protein
LPEIYQKSPEGVKSNTFIPIERILTHRSDQKQCKNWKGRRNLKKRRVEAPGLGASLQDCNGKKILSYGMDPLATLLFSSFASATRCVASITPITYFPEDELVNVTLNFTALLFPTFNFPADATFNGGSE